MNDYTRRERQRGDARLDGSRSLSRGLGLLRFSRRGADDDSPLFPRRLQLSIPLGVEEVGW